MRRPWLASAHPLQAGRRPRPPLQTRGGARVALRVTTVVLLQRLHTLLLQRGNPFGVLQAMAATSDAAPEESCPAQSLVTAVVVAVMQHSRRCNPNGHDTEGGTSVAVHHSSTATGAVMQHSPDLPAGWSATPWVIRVEMQLSLVVAGATTGAAMQRSPVKQAGWGAIVLRCNTHRWSPESASVAQHCKSALLQWQSVMQCGGATMFRKQEPQPCWRRVVAARLAVIE